MGRRLRSLATLTLGLAGLLALTTPVRAEYFEFTTKVTIDSTAGTFTPAGAMIDNPAGNLSASLDTGINKVTISALSSNPAPPHLNGSIGTDIVPLDIDTASGLGETNEAVAFNFSIELTVTNYSTLNAGAPSPGINTGSVTFTGRLGGTMGDGAVDINLLSFASSPSFLQIGNEAYTIAFNNFASPGADNNGRLTLHVSSRVVPEPGSLALVGMGAAGIAGVVLRRRYHKSV